MRGQLLPQVLKTLPSGQPPGIFWYLNRVRRTAAGHELTLARTGFRQYTTIAVAVHLDGSSRTVASLNTEVDAGGRVVHTVTGHRAVGTAGGEHFITGALFLAICMEIWSIWTLADNWNPSSTWANIRVPLMHTHLGSFEVVDTHPHALQTLLHRSSLSQVRGGVN